MDETGGIVFKDLVVGLNGSTAATHAFAIAVDLAEENYGTVHVVSVEDRLPAFPATIGETLDEDRRETLFYRRVQSAAIRELHGRPVMCSVSFAITRGRAAEQLVQIAQARDADLLVIGRTRHSRILEALLGSTPQRLLRNAPCPVLVVPDKRD